MTYSPSVEEEDNDFARMNGVVVPGSLSKQEEGPLAADLPPQDVENGKDLETADEPEQFVTKRQRWEQPWHKAILIGAGTLILVAFFGSMMNGTLQAIKRSTGSDSTANATSKPKKLAQTVDDDEQNSKISALTTQANAIAAMNGKKAEPPQVKQSEKPVVIATAPVPPPSPSRSYTPLPAPARFEERLPVESAAPPPIARPIEPRPVATTPTKPRTPEDEQKQWLEASNIGSFGGGSASEQNSSAGPQVQPPEAMNRSQSLPSGGLGVTPAPASYGVQSGVQTPPRYQPANSADPSTTIQMGTQIRGELETPYAWSGNSSNAAAQNLNLRIRLKEALKALNGQVLIPKDSYLLAQANQTNSAGLLQLKVVAVQIASGGQLVEKPVPAGALLIFGTGGQPLRGDYHGPRTRRGFLSGIGNAAGIAGLANNSSSLYAFDALQQLQQNRQNFQSQPTYYSVKQGTSLEVYVNQSFSLQP